MYNTVCKCGLTCLSAGAACLVCLSASLGFAARLDHEATKHQIQHNLLPVDPLPKPVGQAAD
jgi:hypothetical protein